MLDGITWTRDLNFVGRLQITLEHYDSASYLLRLLIVGVVGKDRYVHHVSLRSVLRDRRGNLTGLLVNLDGPGLTVLTRQGLLVFTVVEGVTVRRCVSCVTTQTSFRKFRSETDIRVRLTGYSVVSRHLDVHNGLELSLNLIGGAIRVGCLHLRGYDGARRDRVVGLCGDLTVLIDGNSPTIRDSRRVNLEFRRSYHIVAL